MGADSKSRQAQTWWGFNSPLRHQLRSELRAWSVSCLALLIRKSCFFCASSRLLRMRDDDHPSGLARLGRLERGQLPHPIGEVGLADDVVAIENAPSLVPQERHGRA